MFRKKMKSMRTLITRHIPLVCLSGLLLLLGACTKDDSGRAEPTGTLQLNLTVAGKVIPLHSKAAGDYNPLDISTLWIYKVESDGADGTVQELIRKYKPATSVPDNLYLVYVPVKWTREITDCKAGQWRKISIKILNATQGNIQFQMTVENWVYDQKIDVDVMQLFAFAGEETIPDEDLSDPNSPVVTLDGRDIAQGYTISKSMFDEELGKWSENLKAVITPQADASVRTAKLVFSSDNAELLAALDGAGYVNGTIPVWPQNDDLLAYLVMKEAASTHILAGTVKDAGMSGLFGYKGTHKVKFVVTDTKGRTSYTNLTVKVTEGGSVGTGPEVKWTNKAGTVSYDFGTRYKITKLSDSEADPEVKITVTSQTGIVGFSVDINSTTLTPEELQGLGLSTHMDLVNPGSFEGPLTNLGFPTGSAVAGKKSLTFDISSFMPMLTVLGPGNSDFKLTVIDASGSVSKTIQLYVP